MKYGDKKSRHRYEVKACRRVRSPQYGPEAYFIDCKEEVFPYGKGQAFTDGESARLAAVACAHELMPLASDVSIWKCNGYGGRGNYLKESHTLFSGRWPELEKA